MSQVNKSLVPILCLITGLLVLVGCSDSRTNSGIFVNGEHPAGWLPAGHVASAQADITTCESCHAPDLSGGIAGVSCVSCHLGGANSVHPAEWSGMTGTAHAPYATANGTAACANEFCHGTTLGGVPDSGPSCSSCHLGGPTAIHPAAWGTAILTQHGPYVVANSTAACANAVCHGLTLNGVAGSGPSCKTACHSFP